MKGAFMAGRLRACTIGVCPRCLHIRGLSKHHMFPKRFFGNGNGNRSTLFLCLECHELIEDIIPFSVKLRKEQYLEIHRLFLQGGGYEELSAKVRVFSRKKTEYKNGRVNLAIASSFNFAKNY